MLPRRDGRRERAAPRAGPRLPDEQHRLVRDHRTAEQALPRLRDGLPGLRLLRQAARLGLQPHARCRGARALHLGGARPRVDDPLRARPRLERRADPHDHGRLAREPRPPLPDEREHLLADVEPDAGAEDDARPGDRPRRARRRDARAARGGHGSGDVLTAACRRRPRHRGAGLDLLARRRPQGPARDDPVPRRAVDRARAPGCSR